jgi:hypothetical protein
VLNQLSEIRQQVSEANIARQLDSALGKKRELISIEEGLLADLTSAATDLDAEIIDTTSRLQSMNEVRWWLLSSCWNVVLYLPNAPFHSQNVCGQVLSRLPEANDKDQARAYSWFEIRALQVSL